MDRKNKFRSIDNDVCRFIVRCRRLWWLLVDSFCWGVSHGFHFLKVFK